MQKVYVTNHAEDRWLERASTYGDETKEDVRLAVLESRQIGPEELLPFRRVDGSVYLEHERTKSIFIAQNVDADSLRIVSIVVPGTPPNAPRPKRKLPSHKEEEARKLARPTPGDAQRPAIPESFADVGAQRNWLVAETQRLAMLLGGMGKLSPQYAAVSFYYQKLCAWMQEFREEWKSWKHQKDAEDNAELVREDGTLNLRLAYKLLKERVEKLEAEVEKLRTATPTV